MTADLSLYNVTVGKRTSQMRLNAADAKAMGAAAVLAEPVTPVVVVVEVPEPVDVKSRLVTSNKMRGTDEARPHVPHGSREGAR